MTTIIMKYFFCPESFLLLFGEALISALELEQFGRNGDAGPFGIEPSSDPTFGDPPRHGSPGTATGDAGTTPGTTMGAGSQGSLGTQI